MPSWRRQTHCRDCCFSKLMSGNSGRSIRLILFLREGGTDDSPKIFLQDAGDAKSERTLSARARAALVDKGSDGPGVVSGPASRCWFLRGCAGVVYTAAIAGEWYPQDMELHRSGVHRARFGVSRLRDCTGVASTHRGVARASSLSPALESKPSDSAIKSRTSWCTLSGCFFILDFNRLNLRAKFRAVRSLDTVSRGRHPRFVR